MTSGRRYFSAAVMIFHSPLKTQSTQSEAETFHRLASSLCTLCLCGESLLPLLIFRRFRFTDRGQQLLDDILACLTFGLGLEVRADAMAEHRDGYFLDVVDGDTESPVHGRDGLA